MLKKSVPKKSQPKSKKPDPMLVERINQKLDHMEEVLDRIVEILAQKEDAEDSPDTPDEVA